MKNIIIGLKNIFYYFKVIWNDRDWDHAYMEDIMLAKLKKWYKKYSGDILLPYVGLEKDLQAMRICINILERRRNDWYTNSYHDKYGHKVKFNLKPSENHKMLMIDELTEEERQKDSDWLIKYNMVEERDWKIFCRLFEKYMNKWWD